MSKRWMGLCAAMALPLFLTGCGATSGFLRDSMTQTQIQGSGFRIITTGITAKAQSGSALCSIPVGEGEVYRRAMEELNAQAKLAPNQMIVNIREDVKTVGYLFFYCVHEVTLSADVIEFGDMGAVAAPPAPPPAEAAPPPPPAEETPAPAAAPARPAAAAAAPAVAAPAAAAPAPTRKKVAPPR